MSTGVFTATKKDGTIYYRSSLTYKRKHISLGSFPSYDEAHSAYLEGLSLIKEPSISLLNFREDNVLPFEKWVSILNFRDNKIYFGTPIYIGQKLFYYYISPTHILKFDMDDLFYYSSHKIMKRGNHYFVADYGMQVNIASRYGIKPYAVIGRDYRFLNEDRTDFRRENIEIFNAYNGIRKERRNGSDTYIAYVHINGNFIIGRYDDEITAAIAYNKAVDILKKNGVKKNYTPNYIDNMNPRQYAEIYSAVSVSEKILNYKS